MSVVGAGAREKAGGDGKTREEETGGRPARPQCARRGNPRACVTRGPTGGSARPAKERGFRETGKR